jgi:diacylglycerol kinase family enzyme
VTFVQWRERLEPRFGYWLASIVAGVRMLIRLRTFRVTLEVDGVEREYRTPLVFIGVGERELKIPTLGKRVPNGRRGLHVIVLRTRSGARAVATALAAAARGIERVSRTPELDAYFVEECTITAPFRKLAVDGELVTMRGPLHYSIARDALRVVVPEPRAEQ